MTKEKLAEVTEKVRDEADHEASFYGCQVVVIVVDKEGAFQTRGSPDLNINTTVGILTRAAHAFATEREYE